MESIHFMLAYWRRRRREAGRYMRQQDVLLYAISWERKRRNWREAKSRNLGTGRGREDYYLNSPVVVGREEGE